MHSPRVKFDDVVKGVPESDCRLEWYSSIPRVRSVVNLRVGLLVREVQVEPLSHADDNVVEVTWSRHDVDDKSC
jgi:hypothetical protein